MKSSFPALFSFVFLSASAFGQLNYSHPIAGAVIVLPPPPLMRPGFGYPGRLLPVPVVQQVQINIREVAPRLTGIDTNLNGIRTSRVMDTVELRNRLLGLHFAPPLVDAHISKILAPQPLPLVVGPIVGATESVLLEFGRLPF